MYNKIKQGVVLLLVVLATACGTSEENANVGDAEMKATETAKVPVVVKIIKQEVFNHYIEVSGTVGAVNEAFISPEMNGQIKKIHVNEGARVKKGDLIISLNTSVIDKSIEELKTGLELARTIYSKQKELWDQKIGSEIQYLQAKNSKESLEGKLQTLYAQLDMARVKAPFDGIVDEIMQKEGELATLGRQIVQMVNLSKMEINADVSEMYLPKVKKGDLVKVEFPAYPELREQIPIYRTGNIVNPSNRTFKVQLRIGNKNETLKPNIISILHINDYSNNTALVVPSIIIKKDNNGDFLFTAVKEDGKLVAKKTYIKSGMSYKDNTEVHEGIKEGDQVVVNGYNMVATGTIIEITKN